LAPSVPAVSLLTPIACSGLPEHASFPFERDYHKIRPRASILRAGVCFMRRRGAVRRKMTDGARGICRNAADGAAASVGTQQMGRRHLSERSRWGGGICLSRPRRRAAGTTRPGHRDGADGDAPDAPDAPGGALRGRPDPDIGMAPTATRRTRRTPQEARVGGEAAPLRPPAQDGSPPARNHPPGRARRGPPERERRRQAARTRFSAATSAPRPF